jgi:hypothetical protein
MITKPQGNFPAALVYIPKHSAKEKIKIEN